jgi:hypothetical protein
MDGSIACSDPAKLHSSFEKKGANYNGVHLKHAGVKSKALAFNLRCRLCRGSRTGEHARPPDDLLGKPVCAERMVGKLHLLQCERFGQPFRQIASSPNSAETSSIMPMRFH